jgi:hypothetical protein
MIPRSVGGLIIPASPRPVPGKLHLDTSGCSRELILLSSCPSFHLTTITTTTTTSSSSTTTSALHHHLTSSSSSSLSLSLFLSSLRPQPVAVISHITEKVTRKGSRVIKTSAGWLLPNPIPYQTLPTLHSFPPPPLVLVLAG